MHSYSNEFLAKISKPKMSSRPMNVNLFFVFLRAGRLEAALESAKGWLIEIDALIF